MSMLSMAIYSPIRRVRITGQRVGAAADIAMIDVVPDKRFRPICHDCGAPAGAAKATKRRVPQRVTPSPKAFSRARARFSPPVSLSPTPSSTYAHPALS